MCKSTLRCPITYFTIERAELSCLFYFPSCFDFGHGHLDMLSEDQIPVYHMSILSLCRISQWVTQEVNALVFPAVTHDLLWTLTSSELRDKPCIHLGCHDKHKPGSAGRLSLIRRLLCKSASIRFEFQNDFFQLPTSYSFCLVSFFRRWEIVLLQIKERWDKGQAHQDKAYAQTKIMTCLKSREPWKNWCVDTTWAWIKNLLSHLKSTYDNL